ncbi:LacI family transcriptional regulator [Murinocardiopsis flavida]|uniref:LacI family transcriptional regulator n=1 Tax=Murinocardiopsis flavida TaxID=645275 RepID=A0A2P8DDZ3_9ACTN|nr:LacI family DNA-binding transcriptional regulator [Murinocardiopsis flavida]PSK95422.1 LacI family transcriptional regulator [Murinocardiopsis flavida]
MTRPRRRVTQKDIARMTGVSQAVVSLVLNNRTDTGVRIAPETRARVLRAIRDTGYVADPAARSLVARRNRILAVFTAEGAFPHHDRYRQLLAGVEAGAERTGSDLLLLSSAPVSDGRRRIFRGDERFRLADGLLVLGGEVDRSELVRLADEEHPCVSVGPGGDPGGPVPSIGADYPAAAAALVRRAVRLGHTRLAYIGPGGPAAAGTGQGPEARTGLLRGFRAAVAAAGADGALIPAAAPGALLDALAGSRRTVAFVDEPADAAALAAIAAERGVGIPGDLSVVVPGLPPDTGQGAGGVAFSGSADPRAAMGRAAVGLLSAILDGADAPGPRLLDCAPVEGRTMAPPRRTGP